MDVPKKNIVGRKVQQVRLRRKVTQDQLSAKLAQLDVQIDRAGISKIETGIRCVYDFELRAIAKVLDVTTVQLLGE
jgi:hypothetical protein